MAFGVNASCGNGQSEMAFGLLANTSNNYAMAIGELAKADKVSALAFGAGTDATGVGASAIGSDSSIESTSYR